MAAARSSMHSRPLLVGRDAALNTVLEVAAEALAEGGIVRITGEAGMGKTALLAEVVARLEGWKVLSVPSDSFESDLSYATVETLMRRIGSLVATPLQRPRMHDDALTVGRVLLDAIDTLQGPVCFIFDDAQWIDEASSRALRFVARRVTDRSFLIIGATRPPTNESPSMYDSLVDGSAHHTDIALTPLTVTDCQELSRSILGHSISLRTATRLTAATQGSPLLLSMLLRQLRESITGALHPAGWDMPSSVAVAPLTAAVTAALEGASPSTRATAELIAMLRDPIPMPQFGSIAERLGEETDADGAIRAGLVHSVDRDGIVWLEPAHAMLADALSAEVDTGRRVEIHRVAAEVLSGHRALRHRVEAADRSDSKLVDELLAASRDAADLGQSEQAMSYARSAVHLAPAGAKRERCLLEIGLLAMRTRQHQRIFDLHPDIEALPQSLVRDTILVELRILTGDVPRAFTVALAALADDDDSPDARVLRSRVAGAVPKLQMATRDFLPVIEQIASARTILAAAPSDPDEIADPAVRWMVEPVDELLRLLGWLMTAAGHTRRDDVLRKAVEEMDALSVSAADSSGLADALVTRARIFIMNGQLTRAYTDLEKANRLIRSFPMSWTAGHGRTIYAHVLFLLGEWDESVTVADSAVALALDETDLSGWPSALTASALVRAGRGEADAVAERLESAGQAKPGIAGSYDLDLPWIARAELARALDRRDEQLSAADAAMERSSPASTLGWLTYRVDALAALGRAAEARAALAGCTDPARRWQPYYGSLAWLEGRVAEAEGDTAAAHAFYTRACEAPDAEEFPLPFAVALSDAARLMAQAGMRHDAAAALTRAMAIFGGLGAGGYLERCMALLATLSGEDAAAPVDEDPFSALTTRERQVAHALVAGMTNKEIAERLYVSVTTVNFHVRNILAKLGLTSRRELRRLASAARERLAPARKLGTATRRSPVKN